jgi:hypothetical protein
LLDAKQRSQRARLAGLSRSAKYDGREVTAQARATFLDSFGQQVDPDGSLSPAERDRRATAARRAHFVRMAFESAKARARNKTAAGSTSAAIPQAIPEVHGSDATPAT